MRASLEHKTVFQSATVLEVIAPLQRPEGQMAIDPWAWRETAGPG